MPYDHLPHIPEGEIARATLQARPQTLDTARFLLWGLGVPLVPCPPGTGMCRS
jgi:hypothetical protein